MVNKPLFGLSIAEDGALKSPTIIVGIFFFYFYLVSPFFLHISYYFGIMNTFMIFMSSR